jgi:hypothetical protein
MPGLAVYNTVGHYTVDGWIQPPILHVVAALSREQARRGVEGAVAEIGVHHGRFFISLLLTDPEGPAVAVDVFDDQALNLDGMGKTTRSAFERNLRRHADGAVAPQVWAKDSTTLGGDDFRTAVGPVRLFSVDGGHSREVVAQDMRTAADALCEGGVVIADDVFNFGWPGVVEGTLDFMDSADDVVPFMIGFNKVLFTQPEFSEDYRDLLSDVARRRNWQTLGQQLRGHAVLVLSGAPVARARTMAKRVLRRG